MTSAEPQPAGLDTPGPPLPKRVETYFAATADGIGDPGGTTSSWDQVRLRPRLASGDTPSDRSVTVGGARFDSPIWIAPMAQLVAAHPLGEVAVGTTAADCNVVLGVSTNTAVRFEDIARTGATWWFQVYLMRDRHVTRTLIDRAVAAGAAGLLLTCDGTSFSDTDIDPSHWPPGPDGARLANLTADERARAGADGLQQRPVTVEDVSQLTASTELPVVVKGVLRADDAMRCVDGGARGVVVSTHGARRMPHCVPSWVALPEVADAVGDAADVFVDSGVRTGWHAAAALALGARAVFVGRPVLHALNSGGAAGVTRLIRNLDDELGRAQTALGVRRDASDRELVELPGIETLQTPGRSTSR